MRPPCSGSVNVAVKGAEIRPTTVLWKTLADQRFAKPVMAPRPFQSARNSANSRQFARPLLTQNPVGVSLLAIALEQSPDFQLTDAIASRLTPTLDIRRFFACHKNLTREPLMAL
ncbi:hypothetical protein JFU48_10425 [Pseudomonas sp. TH49]|uniref:hypothetical protein n=1 Tax=Pseudomonas sp. TH49 TaxID=2796413 RepID=UPI0019142949|nr:hypothetical protein [Pseudomonas sp. TH49]MBK5341803.1 hypothetical protein [Pseudomonas sp. TH49]